MTGAEREPDALVEVRERLAALLPEAGFPTLLDDVAAVVGDALRQARAEDPDRVSMSRLDYQRLIDARDTAADRADAETERRVAAEARVAAALALMDQWPQYEASGRSEYGRGVAHARDAIRAALSPAQGETEVEG